MDVHFGVQSFFFSYLHSLTERYNELFEGSGETGSSSGYRAGFAKKWNAYSSVMALCKEDILQIDAVVQQPLEKCLLYLSYLNDKAILENAEIAAASKRT
jgi:hypothetical protein